MALPLDIEGTWYNSTVSLDAGELRRADGAMFGGAGLALGVTGGIVRHGDSSLLVSVDGSDVVTVQPGAVVIPGNAVSGTGVYRSAVATATTGNLTARNATNARIDLVVFRALDTDVVPGHGAYKSRVEIIAGTPSGSPAVPTLPTMAVELARITVPATAGGTATVDLSFRTFAHSVGGTMVAPTAARLPATAPIWQRGRTLDTGAELDFDGTSWVPVNSDVVVWKASDTSRSSTTTLANDPHLFLPVVANARYLLDGALAYSGNTFGIGPADMKVDWTIPSGASLRWSQNGPGSNTPNGIAMASTDHSTVHVLGTYGTVTNITSAPLGWFTTGGTAGTLQMRWAQNASDPTAVVLRAGSWIRLKRVA